MTSFSKDELADLKEEILDKIDGIKSSSVTETFLLNQLANSITALFDDDAKKEDIEDLKKWISENVSSNAQQQPSSQENVSDSFTEAEALEEDNEEGDYKDSTPAKNFMTLQSVIDA